MEKTPFENKGLPLESNFLMEKDLNQKSYTGALGSKVPQVNLYLADKRVVDWFITAKGSAPRNAWCLIFFLDPFDLCWRLRSRLQIMKYFWNYFETIS